MLVDTIIDGRKYRVIVPDEAPPENWPYGVIVGPTDLSVLGLPLEIERRLHNELFSRGLITLRDIRRNMQNVQGALMAALHVDVQLILQAYEEAK